MLVLQLVANENTLSANITLDQVQKLFDERKCVQIIKHCTEMLRKGHKEQDRVYFLRARANYYSGKNKKALADINEALKIEKNNANYYFAKGLILGYGNLSALEDISKAVELQSDNVFFQLSKAQYNAVYMTRLLHNKTSEQKTILIKKNKKLIDQAKKALNTVFKSEKFHADAYYIRGRMRELIDDDTENALKDYKQAIKLDPNNNDAKQFYEQLLNRTSVIFGNIK